MIELVFLFLCGAGFLDTARRRGVRGWPFVVIGAVGWLVIGTVAQILVGTGAHLVFSWGWVGLTYLSIFLVGGGGRRMADIWQCLDCQMYNPPTTIVCPCGFDPSRARLERAS